MDKFILAPGPTQCRPELLEVLSEPVMYHRSSDFRKMYQKTREQLAEMMGLNDGEVLILTSSGTGSMEASVANFFNANDHVLVISIGHFGHRFQEICEAYGLNATMLDYPIGETYDFAEVKTYIENHQDLKGVFITHHETSSGVLNALKPVGDLVCKLPDCLLIVDSISGFLAHPMAMSDWHIDCLLASSQKGFLIPPGIAMAGLSRKAIQALDRGHLPRYYNDFRKYLSMLDVNETPFTPNISLMAALHKSCSYLMAYGLENYYAHHYELRTYLAAALKNMGLDTDVVKEENRGNVLVLVRLKEGMNAKTVHDVLDERGFIIATGFGENKTKMLRIGVIGEVCKADIDRFLVTFREVLEELYGPMKGGNV